MSRYTIAAGTLAFAGAASGAAAQCTPTWNPLPSVGVNGFVASLIVYDDGSGPALYAAGSFSGGAGTKILRWTGSAWTPLGGGLGPAPSYSGRVSTMAIFDPDGPGPARPQLIAGGDFLTAEGQTANCVAAWNGLAWTPLAGGVMRPTGSSVVGSLAVVDLDGPGPGKADLFVGGLFTTAGGVPAANIARWDGIAWWPLGPGIPGPSQSVGALAGFDADGSGPLPTELYVGTSGEPGLLRWNGAAWTPIPGLCCGTFGYAAAMTVFDDDGPGGPDPEALYLVGCFKIIGTSCWHIARCDGATLQPVGDCFTPIHDVYLSAVYPFDEDANGPGSARLYAGGYAASSGSGVYNAGLAKLVGAQWLPAGPSISPVTPHPPMIAFDDDGSGPLLPALYVGNVGANNIVARYECIATSCYANCDQSTIVPIVNVNDFICFLNTYAAGSSAANCDNSTIPPVLNVNDFSCFLNRYAAGCT